MKKPRTFLFILGFLLFTRGAIALSVPNPTTYYVNDYAGMLDAGSKEELEEKLKAFEERTSNQILIFTFSSLEGETLEDFSLRLGEKWKIGHKGRDNGAFLLIFKNDRKIRIESGYGLEGALTDAVSKTIIQNQIAPAFRQGDFKSGIFAAADAIIAVTQGEYQGFKPGNYHASASNWVSSIFVFGLFGVIIYFMFVRPFLSHFYPKRFPPIGNSPGSHSWTIGSGSSGGWSSSSWGGGGSSGGGFSGGGGGFGGGGASGSW